MNTRKDGAQTASSIANGRLVWCDVGRGFAIIMVVYFHGATGVLTDVPVDKWWEYTLLRPAWSFSMPLFLVPAGVFAAISLQRSRQTFVDRTVLHFLYLFVVWNIIQFVVRMLFASFMNHPIEDPVRELLMLPIDPLDVTWFLEALIVYYAVIRILRNVPPIYIFIGAAILAMLPESPGYAIGRMQSYGVYFAAGYAVSAYLRDYSGRPNGWLVIGLNAILIFVGYHFIHSDLFHSRVVTVIVSGYGGVATVTAAMWLAHLRYTGWLAYLGRNSLPIFVMHTMFTVATREFLLRTGISDNVAVLLIAVTVAGVLGPLTVFVVGNRLRMPWLFERPKWLHLQTGSVAQSTSPGEAR